MISRGNYRGWIFKEEGAKQAFEECLGEAVVRAGWVVHGWVIMGNHYHLAVETPKGNLGIGMQWLQTTYSVRFNRYRKESGHVFQGRYKAIVVEPGEALGRVCHYIDLNPVRAGVVGVDQLESYVYGSYRRLQRPKERTAWQNVEMALQGAGGLRDTASGRAAYRQYLGWVVEELKAGREKKYLNLSKGWVIGGEAFTEDLQKRFGPQLMSARALDSEGRRAWREGQWSQALQVLLKKLPSKDKTDLRASAVWKAVVAAQMKATTDATNAWLASRLTLSSPTYVSKQAGLARDGRLGSVGEALLTKLKSKG
ncbi:MAG TPA: transposase [Opitutaceae bacterium]|nr:transposase [Opitutaceae bacterium]